MSTYTLLPASVHEAGHALAAVALGMPVDQVLGGRTTVPIDTAVDSGRLGSDDVTAALAVALAGLAAELRYLTACGWPAGEARCEADRNSQRDQQWANRIATRYRTHPDTGRALADRIITTHWRQLWAIATELDHTGRLTGRRVRALTGRAARPGQATGGWRLR